jgi:hypothetical protein
MTDPREAAIHCEMLKYALRQSKDGIIVSFVLHPHEVPRELQTAEIGSRWMVDLTEIGDDEQPVHRPAKEHPEVAARPKGSWRDLQPAAQAGIRCADPVFRQFLAEEANLHLVDEETASTALRAYCGINSRKELSTNHKARVLWKQLDDKFQAWKLADVQ